MKTQEETNLDDPSERFVWAFRGVEFNGMPLAMPEPVLEQWSRHLSSCGFVHADQVIGMLGDSEAEKVLARKLGALQEIHYQPPLRGQDHAMNMSGEWVPIDQPVQQAVVPTSSLMTAQEKAKMIEEFREEGLID